MENFKCPLFFIFLFCICLELALIICQPYGIFLFAFISNVAFIPRLLFVSCAWITVFHSVFWNRIPCLLLDPFMPLVFLPGHEDAFSSERKNQFPLSWRAAQVFYLASNTVLYFLNKGAFLRSAYPARNNYLLNFSARQSGLFFLNGHCRMKMCIFFFKFYLFVCFWLCWIFVAVEAFL